MFDPSSRESAHFHDVKVLPWSCHSHLPSASNRGDVDQLANRHQRCSAIIIGFCRHSCYGESKWGKSKSVANIVDSFGRGGAI